LYLYLSFKFILLAEHEEESLCGLHQGPLKTGKTGQATWTAYGTKYKSTADHFCKNVYFNYPFPNNLTDEPDF